MLLLTRFPGFVRSMVSVMQLALMDAECILVCVSPGFCNKALLLLSIPVTRHLRSPA